MWEKTTREYFDEAHAVLPPAYIDGRGFLVGEAIDYAICTVTGKELPRYEALWYRGDDYWFSTQPLTIPEYMAEKGP